MTTEQIVDQEQYQAPAYYCPTPFPNNQDTDPMFLKNGSCSVSDSCLIRYARFESTHRQPPRKKVGIVLLSKILSFQSNNIEIFVGEQRKQRHSIPLRENFGHVVTITSRSHVVLPG